MDDNEDYYYETIDQDPTSDEEPPLLTKERRDPWQSIGSHQNMRTMNAEDDAILTRQYQNECRKYIDVADELRSMGMETIGITIAVAGNQSSGKSSVMEALSGVNLPRGEGVVTRCPLEMQLRMGTGNWRAELSYEARIGDDRNVTRRKFIITDKSEVEAKIREAQNEITGQDVVISKTPIRLQIEAPDLPNLTLIDLPGIVHVESENQSGIIDLVSDLVNRYIANPNTLILAILSAENDLEVNSIITKARAVDPDGLRTIGVITKCDCIVGTHGRQRQLVAAVTNSRFKISQFFFVKCRSSEDLTTAERLKEERDFFLNDPFYSRYNHDKLGIESMSRFLVQRQVNSIKDSAAEYLTTTKKKLRATMEELECLPTAPSNDPLEIQKDLSRSLNTFYQKLRDAIICGFHCFTEVMTDKNSKSLYVQWTESLKKLAKEMLEHTEREFEVGRFSANSLEKYLRDWRLNIPNRFGHYKAYESFITAYVNDYSEMINLCMKENLDIMIDFLDQFMKEQFDLLMPHAPHVAEEVRVICETHCKDCHRQARKEVERYIEMQRHFLNLPRTVLSRQGAGYLDTKAERSSDGISSSTVGLIGGIVSVVASQLPGPASQIVDAGTELVQQLLVTESPTCDEVSSETDIFRSSMMEDVQVNAGASQLPGPASQIVDAGTELAEQALVTGSPTCDKVSSETDIFRSSMMADVQTLNERVHQNVGMCIRTKFHDGFVESILDDLIGLRSNPDICKDMQLDLHATRRSELDNKRQQLERAVGHLRTISR